MEAGFTGPERTKDGLAYHRPGLHIETRLFGGPEPEVATTVTAVMSTGEQTWAQLDCLYVACRCRPLQDVPGNVSNQKVAAKRVRQHAEALRKVLRCLLGATWNASCAAARDGCFPIPDSTHTVRHLDRWHRSPTLCRRHDSKVDRLQRQVHAECLRIGSRVSGCRLVADTGLRF